MTGDTSSGQGRLKGRTLFLSASIPSPERSDQFRRVPDCAFEIEQAVISLARTVFSEGGRMVFGGHPTISPLVATVAGEYHSAADEPPVLIYQSRAFEGFVPRDTIMMFEARLARERWVDAVDGERFDPKTPRDQLPCPLSMQAMRECMIGETRPDAMVCIGGMEGVLLEASLFSKLGQGRPIFSLARTGGAASLLPTEPDERLPDTVAERIDERVIRLAAERRAEAGYDPAEPGVTPYPLIMETIVARVARLG